MLVFCAACAGVCEHRPTTGTQQVNDDTHMRPYRKMISAVVTR